MASVAAPASAPPTPPAILLAIVDAAVLDPMTAAVVAAAAAAFDAAAATLATIAEIAIPKIPPCTEFRILSRPRSEIVSHYLRQLCSICQETSSKEALENIHAICRKIGILLADESFWMSKNPCFLILKKRLLFR